MVQTKRTKLFFDLEFTGLSQKTTPISLGIVSQHGHTFYAEFTDYDKSQVNDWIRENVISKLRLQSKITASCGGWENWLSEKGKYPDALAFTLADKNMEIFECIGETAMIQNRLEKWLAQFDAVEFWGDVCHYDWVVFCEIFGGAFSIPKNVYYICFDVATLFMDYGLDPDTDRESFVRKHLVKEYGQHNALDDANKTHDCFVLLEKNYRGKLLTTL